MSVHKHQIIEVDCKIEHLDRSEILAKLEGSDYEHEEAYEQHIDLFIDECLASFRPRGVYRLFNPSICTLPPDYTEPAIKLVGTMMIVKGKDVYDRMRKATHCTLLAVNIASPSEIEALHAKLCYTELDEKIFDACCDAIAERAADIVTTDIIRAAVEEGLYTDGRLSPGEGNFPLEFRDQIAFYLQAEKRLDLIIDENMTFEPKYGLVSIIGMYDKTQKGRRRACGRCKYREFCSIRAIGMNCHGGKGSFK